MSSATRGAVGKPPKSTQRPSAQQLLFDVPLERPNVVGHVAPKNVRVSSRVEPCDRCLRSNAAVMKPRCLAAAELSVVAWNPTALFGAADDPAVVDRYAVNGIELLVHDFHSCGTRNPPIARFVLHLWKQI